MSDDRLCDAWEHLLSLNDEEEHETPEDERARKAMEADIKRWEECDE